MDHVLRTTSRRLIFASAFLVLAFGGASAHAATMPTVQPIHVEPISSAPGNGILTKVTYQVGGAAVNDAGVAAAANEASYVTRAVTMSGGTVGGIVRGAVAGGSKLLGWVGLAITAYQVYKWYTDSNGVLQSPGTVHAGWDCSGSSYWKNSTYSTLILTSCSLPGMQALMTQYFPDNLVGKGNWTGATTTCTQSGSSASCLLKFTRTSNGQQYSNSFGATLLSPAPVGTSDPTYQDAPAAVTNDQLAQLAQQNPSWWPDMFTDPLTGNVVVNPDIAHDMDALKQDLAPKYGVDPTTLTPTPSDPNYGSVVGSPKQTDLPQYCAWAAAACDYYKFVEDNWPDGQKKQYGDSGNCDVPPSCAGDEVMCGVALQAFKTKCAVDGIGGDEPPDAPDHQVQELYGSDVDLGDTSKLDMSGFGLSTACPFNSIDAQFGDQAIHVPLDFICENGTPLRFLVLIGAAMACAAILGLGGRKVA